MSVLDASGVSRTYVCRRQGAPPKRWNGASLRKLVKETCPSAGCLRRTSTTHLHQRSSAEHHIDGQPGAFSEMHESFSTVIFVYGMAFVLGMGKACTLLIWRALPRSRPGLRQEVKEAWQRRTRRKSLREAAGHP